MSSATDEDGPVGAGSDVKSFFSTLFDDQIGLIHITATGLRSDRRHFGDGRCDVASDLAIGPNSSDGLRRPGYDRRSTRNTP
jgi:hypothetical protein